MQILKMGCGPVPCGCSNVDRGDETKTQKSFKFYATLLRLPLLKFREQGSHTIEEAIKESAMTSMTRFVPFRAPLEDVAVLQNRLNFIFHNFAMPSNSMQNESLAAGNFVPAVDIYEDSYRLLLKLEVPGIRQEDLDIRVENQTLTVKGERKFAQDENEENF
jgi:HSP20 family molecular chaperone IbpA